MATRAVILSAVLLMSLMMAQTKVDAKVCCPSSKNKYVYNMCRVQGFTSESDCAQMGDCKIVGECPPGYNDDILENSADAIKKYCNLGCVSSACGALTTLQNSAPNAIVNGAVEKCTKACSTICTKGSMTAVETA